MGRHKGGVITRDKAGMRFEVDNLHLLHLLRLRLLQTVTGPETLSSITQCERGLGLKIE